MFQSHTMKDIAKALGLSTSTVSRALNGSYEIGAETKKLVQEYAKKINYRPNPIALSLKEQKSHSIGVVVCEVANNYFSQAINGIESIAYDKDYHVIITQTHESAEREVVNVQHLLSRHVDGLLVSLSAQTTDLAPYKYLQEKGFPIVFFDRVTDEMASHQITTDNFKGAFEATEHLINAGHTHIGMLTNSENLMISRERVRGYKAALQKHAIPFDVAYVQACEHGGVLIEEVEVAVKQLMSLDQPPNALLSASDRITTSSLVVLNKLGIKIPGDMAVIGFTNSDVAELFDPPLSVVRQPAFQMGQMATEMLIKIIESKRPIEEFASEKLDAELIIRSSSNKLQLK